MTSIPLSSAPSSERESKGDGEKVSFLLVLKKVKAMNERVNKAYFRNRKGRKKITEKRKRRKIILLIFYIPGAVS